MLEWVWVRVGRYAVVAGCGNWEEYLTDVVGLKGSGIC